MRYWAKEILYGVKDLAYKSIYTLKHQITLDNIRTENSGLGIYFKNIQFGPECEDTKEAFREYEGVCMKNYAQILLDMVYGKRVKVDKEGKLFEHLRSIVDPTFYYIIWFMYKEKKERKKTLLKGELRIKELEYEKDIENIQIDKEQAAKTSLKKGRTSQKGEETGKKKHLSMHTLIQHSYFRLFEENMDTLLDEYKVLVEQAQASEENSKVL